jgi:hypothetical protein
MNKYMVMASQRQPARRRRGCGLERAEGKAREWLREAEVAL